MSARLRWTLRALVALGWAICLTKALARGTLVISQGGVRWRSQVDHHFNEHWLLYTLLAAALCLVAALGLLRGAAESPRPRPPNGWVGAFSRGITLSALLAGGLAVYLALGGEDILYFYRWSPVGTAALLGPLLGFLSLLEARQPHRLRARAGWSLLAGALAFGALLMAWIQREYVNEVFLRGVVPAFQHALGKGQALGGDPLWTLAHFGWITLPVACSAFSRFRLRGERVWLALALTGVFAPWWAHAVPAGDAVIATTCILICVLTPLAWRLGDRLQDGLARVFFDAPPAADSLEEVSSGASPLRARDAEPEGVSGEPDPGER